MRGTCQWDQRWKAKSGKEVEEEVEVEDGEGEVESGDGHRRSATMI
jgi:hypothetical protein